jgi:hypothetical protein
MSKSEASDRRQFPRLRESCRIRFKRLEAGGAAAPQTPALTVNISGGGVRFQSGEPAQAGELLAVELTLPEFADPVIALGRVVWCEPRPEGGHELGMEFWWVGWGDDGAQQAVSGHIRKALERS